MTPMSAAESKTAEAALEPDLPICDAHHHLWDRPGRPYLLDHFISDLDSGHNIVSTVAVECHEMFRTGGPDYLKPVGEVEFLQGMADKAERGLTSCRVAATIVGFADLALGESVARVLEAHLAAGQGRFRGIRHSTTWDESGAIRNEAPRGILADNQFCKGFALLKQYDLSFDAWIYHPQIAELTSLAHAFPEIPIILDHVGAPLGIGPYAGKKDTVYQDWRHGMAGLAQCPNVFIKLGGFGSLRSGYDWHLRAARPSSMEIAAAIRPYVEFCIEQFGVHRCMFESNFPVESISNFYVNVWNAFKRLAANFSGDEKAALFHGTAERVYRIL